MASVAGSRQGSGDWRWDDVISYTRVPLLAQSSYLCTWSYPHGNRKREASVLRPHLHKMKHQLPCLCFASMFFGHLCSSSGARLVLLSASWRFSLNFLGFTSHQTGISLSLKAQLVTLGSQNNIQKEFITALGWHWLSWKWTVWNKPPALENNSFLFLLVGRGNKMPHIKRPLVWVSCVTRLSWKHWDSRLFGSLEHGRFHADFQENKGNHEMLEIILLWVCLNQNLIVSECVPGRCCRQCRDGRWGSQDLYSSVGIGNDTSDVSLSATHYLSRNYHHLFLLKVTEDLLMAPGFEG